MGRTYWQLASGDVGRDLSNVFFRFGVACIGPGRGGNYLTNKDWYINKEFTSKLDPFLEIKKDDIVLLKSGQTDVRAIGIVEEENGKVYNYSNFFSDLDGWDMQHYIKVKWLNATCTFAEKVLTRSTLNRINSQEVINWIDGELTTAQLIPASHQIDESKIGEALSFNQIESALIDFGLRIDDAERTTATIERIKKLSNWYHNKFGNEIKASEHETRTFLVIPLLEALGWPPQKLGIEVSSPCGKMDVVLYEDNSRAQPIILIETKILYSGFQLAASQAKKYIKDFPTINRFVVGDGYRYWLYKKQEDNWHCYAYMNFENMKSYYCAYPDTNGMLDFIKELV